MFPKHIIAGLFMASAAIGPANQVSAGSGDIVGGIIGGIIGGAIVNQNKRRHTTTRRVQRRSTGAAPA